MTEQAQPLRVLILNTYPAWGGGEKWMITLALGLKEKGHYVVIATPPGSPADKVAQAKSLVTSPFHIGPDTAFWKIIPFYRILRKHQINVVLCCQNRDVKIGAPAARLAAIPAIFARQGLAMIKNTVEHRFIFTRYIDGIITNTKSIRQLYLGYGWFPDNFIHVVYDGPDIPANPKAIDIHKEFNLIEGSRVIISAGRLELQKRYDLLIEVAKLAKTHAYNWSIVVAGTGKLENELKSMAASAGVREQIRFVGFRNDVLDLYHSSDLFVMSSDAEGMSNSLREAMAMGLPCISTDVYGVEELFDGDQNGIMVPRGDAGAIFRAIESLLSDTEKCKKLGKNARNRIQSSFTNSHMIEKVEEIFYKQFSSGRQTAKSSHGKKGI